ncbi:hypothetical protein [Enterococcus faecalis]|uniref:hypothetical protein n=1 Tax=Enterococcus faecalis TaxID=1351 RepID=UPI000AE86B29|nr:hypothetical protein [Enterococcus faecalis]
MTNTNRFKKFQGLDFDKDNTNSENIEAVNNEVESNTNKVSTFNIVSSSVGMNKKPKNSTLYPSQIERLEELSVMFNRSQSDLVGDFIDQIYTAYKDENAYKYAYKYVLYHFIQNKYCHQYFLFIK